MVVQPITTVCLTLTSTGINATYFFRDSMRGFLWTRSPGTVQHQRLSLSILQGRSDAILYLMDSAGLVAMPSNWPILALGSSVTTLVRSNLNAYAQI